MTIFRDKEFEALENKCRAQVKLSTLKCENALEAGQE